MEKLTEGEQYLLDNLEILKVAKQLQRIKDPSLKKIVFNEKLILILNELGLKLTRIGIYQELTQRIIKIIQEKNPFYVSQIMIEFINQEKYQINQRERERLYRIAVLECQDPKIFNQIIEAANKKNQNQQNLENLEKIKENASKRQMAKIKAQQGIKYATSFLKSTFNYSKKVLKGDKQKSLIGDIRIISLQERKLDNVELKEKIQQFYNHQFDKEEKEKTSNFDLNFFNEQKQFSQEYTSIKKQIKEIKFHEKSFEYSVFIKFTEALIIDSNIDELSNFSQNSNNLYFNKAARNAAISELISSTFEIKDEEILQLRDFNSAHVILSGCIKQLKNQENLEKKYLSSLVQRLSKLEQEKTLITRGFQEGKLKNFLVLMEIINENDYKIKGEIDLSKIQILKIWNQAKVNFEINRLFDSKIIFKTEQKNQDYYQKVLKSFQEQQEDLKNSLQKGSILLVSNCLKLLFKNQIEKNFIKFDQEIHFLYLKKILQENSENEYYIGISEYLQQEINVVLKKFDLEFLYSLLDFSKLQKVENETQMQNYLWLLNAVYENIFESANKQTVYNEIYSSQMIKKLKQEQILIKEIKEFKLLLWDQIDFTGQEISEYQCYLNEQIMNPLFFENQQFDSKQEQICIDMILKIKNLKNIIQNYFEYFILRYLEQTRKQENNLQDIEINHNAILDINKFQTQFDNVLQSQEKIDFSGFVKLCHIDKIFVIYLSQAISNRIIDINNKDFSPVKIIGFIQQLNKEIDLDISKDKFLVYQQILKVIYFLKGDDYFLKKYDYVETIISDLYKFTLQIFQISLAQIEKKLTSIITDIFKKQFQKNNVNSLILAEFIIEAIFYFDQITVNYIKNILYQTAISNFEFEFSIVLGILGYIQPINTFATQEKLTLQEETLQKTILLYKQTQQDNNDEDVEYKDSLEKFDDNIIEYLSKILNKQDQQESQNNLFFNLIIHYFGIGQFAQNKQTFKNLKDTLLKQYNLDKNQKQSEILQDIQKDNQVKKIEDIDAIQQHVENILDQKIFIFNAKFKKMDDLLIFNIISLVFNKQFYEAGKLLWQVQKNEQFSDINEVLKNLKQQLVALENGTSQTLSVRKGLKQLIQKVLPDIQKL
ncbi:hypothetical protein PPERSA_04192 [Pseudocohnilembus persalinus]|uniref:Uncharacterized protein n=1 Tax=Pseudocohnilembus persalinus TaxID=266149 RepID=A0A0V0QNJ7_PSEPJ|nr:hypothetical protein PPERSA_04192 [Pseudocohnilembus persalinus]|eukprot:KRX03640.1 hypothetical protein PPERSA_04192 [Pseudocohnilembus persalinus]